GLVLTGHPVGRVPGLVSLCARGADAEALLRELDAEGIEAASGSACTTAVRRASHVLEAIGIDPVTARGALTVSFGEASREGDPALIAQALSRAVSRLRALSPLVETDAPGPQRRAGGSASSRGSNSSPLRTFGKK